MMGEMPDGFGKKAVAVVCFFFNSPMDWKITVTGKGRGSIKIGRKKVWDVHSPAFDSSPGAMPLSTPGPWSRESAYWQASKL